MRPTAAGSGGGVALFLDLDNILSDTSIFGGTASPKEYKVSNESRLSAVVDECNRRGRVHVQKAYGDSMFYKDLRKQMAWSAIEIVDCPCHGSNHKNNADVKMCVDALYVAMTVDHVDTFVFASGDSDFSPLLSKLRELNKNTIVISQPNSLSGILRQYADVVLDVDDLVLSQPVDSSLTHRVLKALHILSSAAEVTPFATAQTTQLVTKKRPRSKSSGSSGYQHLPIVQDAVDSLTVGNRIPKSFEKTDLSLLLHRYDMKKLLESKPAKGELNYYIRARLDKQLYPGIQTLSDFETQMFLRYRMRATVGDFGLEGGEFWSKMLRFVWDNLADNSKKEGNVDGTKNPPIVKRREFSKRMKSFADELRSKNNELLISNTKVSLFLDFCVDNGLVNSCSHHEMAANVARRIDETRAETIAKFSNSEKETNEKKQVFHSLFDKLKPKKNAASDDSSDSSPITNIAAKGDDSEIYPKGLSKTKLRKLKGAEKSALKKRGLDVNISSGVHVFVDNTEFGEGKFEDWRLAFDATMLRVMGELPENVSERHLYHFLNRSPLVYINDQLLKTDSSYQSQMQVASKLAKEGDFPWLKQKEQAELAEEDTTGMRSTKKRLLSRARSLSSDLLNGFQKMKLRSFVKDINK
eukprot:g5491.t1